MKHYEVSPMDRRSGMSVSEGSPLTENVISEEKLGQLEMKNTWLEKYNISRRLGYSADSSI